MGRGRREITRACRVLNAKNLYAPPLPLPLSSLFSPPSPILILTSSYPHYQPHSPFTSSPTLTSLHSPLLKLHPPPPYFLTTLQLHQMTTSSSAPSDLISVLEAMEAEAEDTFMEGEKNIEAEIGILPLLTFSALWETCHLFSPVQK